ncbi:MAG TPA: long-chain fatty acid--CoA ligase [Spirochaetota bacterium]|nr:long-chain fatty acid--CoA ligase [Spirochaetota bacterium]HPC39804.1 long-chain fatty acid--CoA ligase [Spirochaetota bacterium]HPL16330.1 long-chain fatty acid--CoA ligase [Spirochaetota bacterium]HQF09851.1 long-chain fatty acid--CoA ligase [Spirochaetota bacterium]HQH98501.1 long-chain fatty acid--CoA ligase [Spirochaetota bacterium]
MDKPWLKSYAPGVSSSLQYEPITLSEVLARTSAKYPDKTALIFLDAKITYRQLNDMVNSFANALIDMGVKPGDKVAMLMPNMPQIVIASYGAWRAGAVVVMNNPLYTDTELEHQLSNSESTVLVTLDLLGPRMIALKPKTPVKKIVIAHIRDHLKFPKKQLLPIVAKDKHRDIPATPDVFEWMDVIKKYPATDPKISVDFESLASLQYTGGTTGVSKGVMLSHKNLSSNVQQISAWFPGFEEGEQIMLGVLPFFHSFGLTAVMNFTIWKAGTDVLIPRPEPKVILEAVHKHKVNFYPAVPTIYVGLLNHPDLAKYDISSIKGCFSGAAPLPVEVIKEFEAKTGSQICEGYGLSETSPVVTINPWGGKTKVGSIGLPIADTEIRIVDLEEGTKDMPQGQPGEVIIRGPQVTSGYYKMPEETAKTVKDGWLFTGDIGTMDEEGYFYIVDRKKDMIIAGGYNIYPRDIDEVLFEHPKILEACAIGVPDSYRGETVKAFVVLKPGETMTAEEVIEYCKEKLAKYKVPTMVEFIDSLPKSGVGKILRKELRAMELAKMKK